MTNEKILQNELMNEEELDQVAGGSWLITEKEAKMAGLTLKKEDGSPGSFGYLWNTGDYYWNGEKISLIGFVDTGNNLYDPYKKRPIILVSNKYKREDNIIIVPYFTAGGEGLLKCIKPDKIFIEGVGYQSNLLIGFSDSPKLIDGVDVILHKDLMKG